ncbi:hypothetical protein A4A49_07347 [Nicotiana attenuata]|uniref:Uncharacterized protein n=1 Tax=Nicotiana attenuata TaxID=49451 RepID=A0A314KUX4_NICAT|nr:hypothetical protein A4A49_07347 [Nicotiana attenuata]
MKTNSIKVKNGIHYQNTRRILYKETPLFQSGNINSCPPPPNGFNPAHIPEPVSSMSITLVIYPTFLLITKNLQREPRYSDKQQLFQKATFFSHFTMKA